LNSISKMNIFINLYQRLNQPFPFEGGGNKNWILTVSISSFVALFLLIFEPFGIENYEHEYKTLIILGYGLVTALAMILAYFVFPRFFKHYFSEEHWTIKRELLTLFGVVTLISLFNFLYGYVLCLECRTFQNGVWDAVQLSVGSTFAVAFFPIVVSVFMIQNQLTKRHLETAVHVNRQLMLKLAEINKPQNTSQTLEQANSLVLAAERLVCVRANDNYADFFYHSPNGIRKEMVRQTLKNIENEFDSDKTIVRCHKSYIVNLSFVKHISGNAQGYKLHLDYVDFDIPVSRNLSKMVLQQISQ